MKHSDLQESRLAFELLLELINLHPSILEHVDDSNGPVGNVFRTANDDLGPLAQRAGIEPDALAATVFQKVTTNSYGIYDGLIARCGRSVVENHLAEPPY